jgi:hydrogenase expression/formation protein HypE
MPDYSDMQLQCPLPKLQFEQINLGHGSGGILTQQLLQRGVFDVLANEYLNAHHDGAILSLQGDVAFSTDSYVVSPYFFPGGNIGHLAVHGTLNDLAMCGAKPRYLSLSFILEEGLPVAHLEEILQTIGQCCMDAGVYVVTGDTKVVERGKGDGIYINTSGIGERLSQASIHHRHIQTGDAILLSGELAEHGMAIMSLREGLQFESDMKTDCANLAPLANDLVASFGSSIHCLRDATRGGLASVLNEFAQETQLGMAIQQTSIPVRETVASACELLGLDPLYVANEGKFIAVVAADQADAVLAAMQADPLGKHAARIGTVTPEHIGQVVMTSAIGGRRVVNMLPGEQLPRIC